MQTVPVTSTRKGAPTARVNGRPPRRHRERPWPHPSISVSSSPLATQDAVATAGGCPRLPEGFIRRPRLMDRLLDDREASLVLLAAPPGYGKTSTLAEWAERDERAFAWITLEEADNDSQRLLATLARDRAAASERGAVLVLDDAQLVNSHESLDVLARLACTMPYGDEAGTRLANDSRPVARAPTCAARAPRARSPGAGNDGGGGRLAARCGGPRTLSRAPRTRHAADRGLAGRPVPRGDRASRNSLTPPRRWAVIRR